MKTVLIGFSLILFTTFLYGQKTAHINTNDLFDLMPEKAAAEKEIALIQLELENHLANMIHQAELIGLDIQQNGTKWSPVVLKSKEEELMKLNRSIEDFNLSAQDELEKKKTELFEPIISKASNAIKVVADRLGYEYVIDSASGSLLVMPEAKNILDDVQKELGIVIIE